MTVRSQRVEVDVDLSGRTVNRWVVRRVMRALHVAVTVRPRIVWSEVD